MKAERKQKTESKIARKLGENCPQRAKIIWEGRPIALTLEARGWRARKRSKALTVDITTPTMDLTTAKKLIKEELDRRKNAPPVRPTGNLRALVRAYLAAPKRVSEAVARDNVARLEKIVADAWGKSLDQAKIADLPALWPAYTAKRQGLSAPDYNTRRPGNAGINSALRMARSILIDSLRPAYAAAGIILPDDADRVIWCAELHRPRETADDAGLIAAWQTLPVASALWWTIGLARFAGMRRDEILHARGKWAIRRGQGVVIELRDRPEDCYWTKTGRPYTAMVMHPVLAEALTVIPPDSMILTEPEAAYWIEHTPQKWLKPYVGAARLPLHRLRGLYADHVRRETEDAILARQQGIKAASLALGHTSTATTEKSYLSAD